jgi:hypothetical protein
VLLAPAAAAFLLLVGFIGFVGTHLVSGVVHHR